MIFYFHLGYPKTGTKFLQQRIFNNIDEISYLGKDFNDNFENILVDIISLSEHEFKLKKEKLIERINIELIKTNKRKILISDERLITSLFLNKKEKIQGNDIKVTISRIYEIFSTIGKVKFLIVIRKQTEILESFLYQISLGSFLQFKLNKKKIISSFQGFKSDQSFIIENFMYAKIYNHLLSLTKSSKLIIFEDLKYAPKDYFLELSDFLDLEKRIYFLPQESIKINKRWDRRKRIIKIFFPNFKNLISNIFNTKAYIYKLNFIKRNFYDTFLKNHKFKYINLKKKENLIKEYYKNDLDLLPEKIKIKIRKYGYF